MPGELREIPRHPLGKRKRGGTNALQLLSHDPVLQDWMGVTDVPAPSQNFAGLNNVDQTLPPDPNGDIGPNHYVQVVNVSFAVWDKTGNLLYGPAAHNTLWSGFGGLCQSHNDGDPIILYDHLADRWLMSQFAFRDPNDYHQCIAVSRTGDPLGAWHRYDFLISRTKFNDYPKFGVWPDGYYMSINQFVGDTPAGAGAIAFERDKMLAGLPAQMVYFDLQDTNPNFQRHVAPPTWMVPPPPAGTPNYFAEVDDDASGWPTDRLSIWEFHVDWNTPDSSTFGLGGLPNAVLNTAPFDADFGAWCHAVFDCIPQPGVRWWSYLDVISEQLMYRLQYRNFGTHQALVANHTVDVDNTKHAGIRWYELHDSGSGWSIHQQGTYAPDSDHRWMGSIAMDSAGNIAVGYSVSSLTTFPSIRYAGRIASDPLGTLAQGETTLIAGSGSQTDASSRWGDYSMMAVDPTDDCTFWYTQEYYATTSNAGWRTRIGSFKFPSCQPAGTPTPTSTATATATPTSTFTPTSTATATVTVTSTPTATPTSTPCVLLTDLDGDDDVDLDDVQLIANAWRTTDYDFNGNNIVDVGDIQLVAANWGGECP